MQAEGLIDCVTILAGGGGTRLWPASTGKRPKQFMKIASEKSLLRETVERSWALKPTVGVFVVCNQQHSEQILSELAFLPPEQMRRSYVLVEPQMRNTAAALFYAAQLLKQLAGAGAINLVQTSDHLIGTDERFAQAISEAAILAKRQNIVVFGLKPGYPATGYGYIERGEPIVALKNPNTPEKTNGYQVLRFTEKPDAKQAGQFVESGRYYWNSGMFCYPAGLFCDELEALTPSIPAALACSELPQSLTQQRGVQLLQPSEQLAQSYQACEPISVDYAIMEKSRKLALVCANFSWNDIGSWDVLANLQSEAQGAFVVQVGDASGNFVRSNLPVALCDVRDLIVVEENGVLLVCAKGSSELVKEARTRLQKLQNQ